MPSSTRVVAGTLTAAMVSESMRKMGSFVMDFPAAMSCIPCASKGTTLPRHDRDRAGDFLVVDPMLDRQSNDGAFFGGHPDTLRLRSEQIPRSGRPGDAAGNAKARKMWRKPVRIVIGWEQTSVATSVRGRPPNTGRAGRVFESAGFSRLCDRGRAWY